MKSRAVTGIEPTMELTQAARRIVAARVAELYACAPAALDGADTIALHDMRVAAKRLRYVLELVGFCLGDRADEALSAARALQTLTGDVHDCDVVLARIAAMPSPRGKGMRPLATRFADRRSELFAQFTTLWQRIERSDLRASLDARTPSSPSGASAGS
jgi:CHAD domain-containing protein